MDFVIEADKETMAIEVKAASRWQDRDLAGLRAFLARTRAADIRREVEVLQAYGSLPEEAFFGYEPPLARRLAAMARLRNRVAIASRLAGALAEEEAIVFAYLFGSFFFCQGSAL